MYATAAIFIRGLGILYASEFQHYNIVPPVHMWYQWMKDLNSRTTYSRPKQWSVDLLQEFEVLNVMTAALCKLIANPTYMCQYQNILNPQLKQYQFKNPMSVNSWLYNLVSVLQKLHAAWLTDGTYSNYSAHEWGKCGTAAEWGTWQR